MVEMILVNKS